MKIIPKYIYIVSRAVSFPTGAHVCFLSSPLLCKTVKKTLPLPPSLRFPQFVSPSSSFFCPSLPPPLSSLLCLLRLSWLPARSPPHHEKVLGGEEEIRFPLLSWAKLGVFPFFLSLSMPISAPLFQAFLGLNLRTRLAFQKDRFNVSSKTTCFTRF